MKSQKHNEGELKEVVVKIEAKVAEDLETMSKNAGIPTSDIVVIALKRYRASHLDYLKLVPMTE
jgi:fructose-1,6-bisphosphatase/sedoheptulose 1,7-bisphosphatase-like protein